MDRDSTAFQTDWCPPTFYWWVFRHMYLYFVEFNSLCEFFTLPVYSQCLLSVLCIIKWINVQTQNCPPCSCGLFWDLLLCIQQMFIALCKLKPFYHLVKTWIKTSAWDLISLKYLMCKTCFNVLYISYLMLQMIVSYMKNTYCFPY